MYTCNYQNKNCSLFSFEKNNDVVELIVNHIINKCEYGGDSNSGKVFNDLFLNFTMDSNVEQKIINRFPDNKLTKLTLSQLDEYSERCSGGVRVRGPASYFLYDSQNKNSSTLIRITSGSPNIVMWNIDKKQKN